MNQFKLFAHGDSFDVDKFISMTSLKFDNTWRLGDLRPNSCEISHFETSGVEKSLGDANNLTIFQQDDIAVRYLLDNRDGLRQLLTFPGITSVTLGLEYVIKISDNLLGFCMGPSKNLMQAAANLGISITYYVTLDRTDVIQRATQYFIDKTTGRGNDITPN